MATEGFLNAELSKKTFILGLKLWVLIGIAVGAFIVLILFMLSIWLTSRRKSRRMLEKIPVTQIPSVSKEIKEVKVDRKWVNNFPIADGLLLTIQGKSRDRDSDRALMRNTEKISPGGCMGEQKGRNPQSGDEGSSGTHSIYRDSSSYAMSTSSLMSGMPEVSHLGWGNWFTLRDLEIATDYFAKENILGEGGYGIVYKGQLANATTVAVKNLFNNLGQAEKEFRVEVEAIGRVRHKNLVRLLGYCVEGTHRILVYEYVDNGNLEQWLHGTMRQQGILTWEARMKIIFGTAKALAYLHEALEPKVVHRDIKASNILIDHDFNAKVSDFGLAKLLGSGKSHVTTRVMGTFGYVAPEYANTGLLNERSDVYSFGVLLLEAITGRDPVDYGRPAGEVNLVDWLKMMVGSKRAEEVLDPSLEVRPSTRALKKALLVALRCVDPESHRRPKMGQVVHMHETDEFLFREDRRNRISQAKGIEAGNQKGTIRQVPKEGTSSKAGGSKTQR
ncbi:hypothetical protein SUGI_0226980 [Cryptomeria japonica]|uniref:probable receptor-like protein kinase At2g42960 n=1 Tax=Cryptomeria japonica TaxID=3369 RepID=UPI002408B006|nr:probable receptor-like protein kinase At2g42960 [Cryptomeria japonica]XP_057851355.1 probable receptor-like protein kinase At2g42960 [Cryptomeria japonica]XP_057851356.1 probable receptor-like protein kinase At2g42960 [Cryptomeria japonica]GLJ14142.1 hypothetical protein SUGI_0226980 [Cryptomeria japonica]